MTPLADPPGGVASVDRDGRRRRPWTVALAAYGVTARRRRRRPSRCCGRLPTSPTVGPGDGSTANNASVVLLAEVRGRAAPAHRRRRAGRARPPSPAALPGLRVDVLKVPHHGSRYQDLDFLPVAAAPGRAGVGRRRQRLRPPRRRDARRRSRDAGARVLRTDRDGDLLVVERDGRLRPRTDAVSAGPRRPAVGGLWQAGPHHGRTARSRRPRPGHPGDRQGGVPQRAHRRVRPRRGPRPRRRGRALRDPGRRPDPGHASARWRRRRCSPAPAAWWSAALEDLPEESVDGPARLRRRPGRGRRPGAGPRRRPEGLAACWPSCASWPPSPRSKSGGAARPSEFPGFVGAEVRRHGATIDDDGRRRSWSRRSARTCAPWRRGRTSSTNDFPGEALTIEKVKRYFGGRAEAKSFAVADAAFCGPPARRRSRSCAGRSTAAPPPVLVTSAFAGGRARRGPLHVGAARACARPTWPARSGVPPWKLRTIRDQSRGWSDDGHRPRDPGDRPGRRRHQGRRQRRRLHPGAAGAHGHRPARAALSRAPPRTTAPHPESGDGAVGGSTCSESGGLLGDGRLAVGGLVLVDDALGGGLVELLGRRRDPA